MTGRLLCFLLTLIPIFIQAQHICKDFDFLVEHERQHYENKLNFRTNANTQNFDIKYHRLEWEVDPRTAFISGTVTTYFIPTEINFDEINFDFSNGMTVTAIHYHGATLSSDHLQDNLQIALPAIIHIGTLDSISVSYKGFPENTGLGAFATGIHQGNPTLWTLSEPYGAKSWWPCKQDLNDKIDSIDIYVTTSLAYKVGSNGILVNEQVQGDRIKYYWKHRYPIAAYLISLAVADYEMFTDYVYLNNGDSIPILNYVYQGNLNWAKTNLINTVEMMGLFNNLFGIYPFAAEKYGHAEFGWNGGMEHQTMSSMGSFGYGLQAHELAHQWFGNKITCGSWQEIWLNEGFATYLTGLTMEYLKPNPQDWFNWKRAAVNRVTQAPDGSTFVSDTTDISRIFDGRLTYTKGALILHMLRWVLGDEDFFQGIRNYLNDPDLSFGYARTADLKFHLEQISGLELTEFFDDWYYGEGYPSYSIDYLTYSDGIDLTIFQSTSHSSVDFYEMPLPIKVSGGGRDTLLKIDHQFSGEFFHVNLPFSPQQVEFDPDFWIVSNDNVVNTMSSSGNVGIEEAIQIFPNPTSNNLQIKLKSGYNEMHAIRILDVHGRVVDNFLYSPGTIDISSLPNGMYTVQYISSKHVFSKNIIKQ